MAESRPRAAAAARLAAIQSTEGSRTMVSTRDVSAELPARAAASVVHACVVKVPCMTARPLHHDQRGVWWTLWPHAAAGRTCAPSGPNAATSICVRRNGTTSGTRSVAPWSKETAESMCTTWPVPCTTRMLLRWRSPMPSR